MNRAPASDGLRGSALALVLFDHMQASLAGRYIRLWTPTGRLDA